MEKRAAISVARFCWIACRNFIFNMKSPQRVLSSTMLFDVLNARKVSF